ncbi:hypothetical protein [Roseomonas populi]|uniref:Phage tail protein n=1 Tax=Roseomonas populi TaxID=3121582 RepID=A0ABT1X141_9PROT|nr:hypothetical protein [Roseomonas pecuniae]MCR0981800.1 hypothetical protein [Roseomonas pecuniae]
MATTAAQLQAAIDSIVQQVADGVQSIRYSDGAGVTYVDAAHAPARLKLLRGELAAVSGLPTRTRIIYQPTAMRRF